MERSWSVLCLNVFSVSLLLAEVPVAPAEYRRPADWRPDRYPKTLQQLADAHAAEMERRAEREMSRVDGINQRGRWHATGASLDRHRCPEWFQDAKLGIFVDWGLWSLAAWCPFHTDRPFYPDWYEDRMHYDPGENGANEWGSRSYHERNWGRDFTRDDFIPLFRARRFDAAKLCRTFRAAGARYVVPFLKHHGGFCLWNSSWTFRDSVDRGPKRDIAAEFVEACRGESLKFGFYYSLSEWEYPFLGRDGKVSVGNAGLWTHTPGDVPCADPETLCSGKVAVRDYRRGYSVPQAVEFIDRYDPDLLWYDGDWDAPAEYLGGYDISAYFYNRNEGRKEVAVNDRYGLRATTPRGTPIPKLRDRWLRAHRGDFFTDESGDTAEDLDPAKHHPWEECHGISFAYGNHWQENAASVMDEGDFIRYFTDIVAKGGNLLLLVNLDAQGAIPKLQEERLLQIGAWLKANGEAIFGTRPVAPYSTADVNYTRAKDGRATYAIVKRPAKEATLACAVPDGAVITELSSGRALSFVRRGGSVVVALPQDAADRPLPVVLKIVKGEN